MSTMTPYQLQAARRRRRVIPRGKKIGDKKNRSKETRRRKRKKNIVRGKEVSVTESSSELQVIYGEMRVGGVITFLETNQDSSAYLITGDSAQNNQLLWTAKTAGSSGNQITLTLTSTGTVAAISISVVNKAITVALKSSGGTPLSTLNEVIAAVRADAAASALVSIDKLVGGTNGVPVGLSQTPFAYGGGTWLHQVVTLTGHEINSIQKLYLDGREVTFGASPDPRWATGVFADRVFMAYKYGTDDQEVMIDLHFQLPLKWTTDHRQRGCAHAYILTVWDPNLFPEGHPEISFLVRGKPLYDTRTSTTAYSKNSALALADFMTSTKYGLGIPWADIDTTTLNDSANVCDEAVSLAAGGTEPRYSTNGVFDGSQSKEEVFEQLKAAMAGDVVEQGGKYFIYAGKYRTPTVTLTEADLRGEFNISTAVSRSESFNFARGTYASPQANYNETDIPHIKNSTYIAQDGGARYEDFTLNFVTSPSQAQRLLKIELEQSRQGISVVWPGTIALLQLRVNDVVNVTLARYGWSSKPFEVQNIDYAEDGDGSLGLDLVLRETASGVYDWNNGEETTVDLAPNTNLPDPQDAPEPTNVTVTSGTAELYLRNDGAVFSRAKVSWTAAASPFVVSGGSYEIQFKQSSSSVWSNSFNTPGGQTFHHILDVLDRVSYDFRIRSVNSLGYASDWVEVLNHIVVGKTEPPSDVTVFSGFVTDLGVQFSWTEIADLDRDRYELRYGASWDAGTLVGRIKGNSFRWENLVAGTYRVFIKALDTSSNYSTSPAFVDIIINGPNPIRGFTADATGKNVFLDWQQPIPSTLSVQEYDVYKGIDFASSIFVGKVFGTFHTYIELVGGDYTYWVVAIDVGGNRSSEVSATATVQPTEDFELHSEEDLDNNVESTYLAVQGGESIAVYEDPNSFFLPVGRWVGTVPIPFYDFAPLSDLSGEESWEEWFTTNCWNTLQDAIDAGYNAWLSPSGMRNGQIIFKLDLGTVLGAAFIEFLWEVEALQGTVNIIPSLAYSEDDITYSAFINASKVFAEDFRYVILRIDGYAVNIFSVARLYDFVARIQLQVEEEVQTVTANSGDAGGTTVTFEHDFLDVTDIQVTANSTDFANAVYDFTDVPNPTSMKVLVFDKNGTRITRTVTCRIRGAVNPA